MTIGAAIKRIREMREMEQTELAARATECLPEFLDDESEEGRVISQPVLSQIESGRTANPSRPRLRAIARALGVTYNRLLLEGGWIDPPENRERGDVLDDLARENPQLLAKLEELRENNTLEVYTQARHILARFFEMGVDTAQDLTGKVRKDPVIN